MKISNDVKNRVIALIVFITCFVTLFPFAVFFHEMGHVAIGMYYGINPVLHLNTDLSLFTLSGSYVTVNSINNYIANVLFLLMGMIVNVIFVICMYGFFEEYHDNFKTAKRTVVSVIFYSIFAINILMLVLIIITPDSDFSNLLKVLRQEPPSEIQETIDSLPKAVEPCEVDKLKDDNEYLRKRIVELKNYHQSQLELIPSGCRGHKNIVFKPDGQYWLECTGSMRPFFTCKDTLSFCKVRQDQIKVNDIIVFENPMYPVDSELQYIIHQIVDIREDGYVTKGYANNDVDPFLVEYNMILGKLGSISYGE